MKAFKDLGYTRAKIKVGDRPLAEDMKRIEAAGAAIGDTSQLAIDAINRYSTNDLTDLRRLLGPLDLWWLEEACDPDDHETQAAFSHHYPGSLAWGETAFSEQEALNILRYGGFRADRDVLLMDPAHCYGLSTYANIVDRLETEGVPRSQFWPHGGHLYTIHIVAAFGLGGAEDNPRCFKPFGGYPEALRVSDGRAELPQWPGIGFEAIPDIKSLIREMAA